jgi:phosphate-selective porin OprO/OprP
LARARQRSAGGQLYPSRSGHLLASAEGWAAGIPPKRRLGAVELVAKYSRVDLTDGAIDGGLLSKWHFGVNWWASAQWKFGLSYGIADLDKGGTRGRTDMLLFRFQWVFI